MTRKARRERREQSGPCMVYILRLKQPTPTGCLYYVGITERPIGRWEEHASPRGKRSSPTVKRFGFASVVCTQWYANRQIAFEKEKQMTALVEKGWEPQEDGCSYMEPEALRWLRGGRWKVRALRHVHNPLIFL